MQAITEDERKKFNQQIEELTAKFVTMSKKYSILESEKHKNEELMNGSVYLYIKAMDAMQKKIDSLTDTINTMQTSVALLKEQQYKNNN